MTQPTHIPLRFNLENNLEGALSVLQLLRSVLAYKLPTEQALRQATAFTGKHYKPDDLELAIADMNALRVLPPSQGAKE